MRQGKKDDIIPNVELKNLKGKGTQRVLVIVLELAAESTFIPGPVLYSLLCSTRAASAQIRRANKMQALHLMVTEFLIKLDSQIKTQIKSRRGWLQIFCYVSCIHGKGQSSFDSLIYFFIYNIASLNSRPLFIRHAAV